MNFRNIIIAACAFGGLAACAQPHKALLDRMSGSNCLAQREQATDGLGAWLDAKIDDGGDTVALTALPYAAIYAEDAKPDDQEDEIALGVAEGIITAVILERLIDFAIMQHGNSAGKNGVALAMEAFNGLPDAGFNLIAWRAKTQSVPCN